MGIGSTSHGIGNALSLEKSHLGGCLVILLSLAHDSLTNFAIYDFNFLKLGSLLNDQ